MSSIVTGSQIKAARALAGLRRCDLARAAKLHPNAVTYWELHDRIPTKEPYAVKRMREALSAKGVSAFAEPFPGVCFSPVPGPAQVGGSHTGPLGSGGL